MNLESGKIEFEKQILAFFERLEINQIVFTSTQYDLKKITKKMYEKLISSANSEKFFCKNAILLNRLTIEDGKSQDQENDAILGMYNTLIKFLNKEVEELCKAGENAYEMNDLFKDTIKLIDFKMAEMDFDFWLKKKDPRNNDNIYFILNQKVRYSVSAIKVNLHPGCTLYIKEIFIKRRSLLQGLKNVLVNIFSRYLFLIDLKLIPVIKISGPESHFSELIYALVNSGRFNDIENAKSILLKMFEISPEKYSKDISHLINTKKKKSDFLNELVDWLERLEYRFKKNKKSAKKGLK